MNRIKINQLLAYLFYGISFVFLILILSSCNKKACETYDEMILQSTNNINMLTEQYLNGEITLEQYGNKVNESTRTIEAFEGHKERKNCK